MTYTTGEGNGRTLADFERLASKQGECWCRFYQRARPVGRGLSSEERKRKNRSEEQSPAQDPLLHMKGCACARFEFWASPCVQFMSAPSMFIRGDGMQMRESDVGENPPSSGMVYLSGESQTPPAYPDRADENEVEFGCNGGNF